jgi:hypothetical protein
VSESETWRARWGVHTPVTLSARARELGAANYLIKGLLPTRSVGLLVGDSGLGKSPLMYQAAICVATGVRFLGRETRKGPVIIFDFENGIADMSELVDRISRCLGLTAVPEDLHLSLNDCLPGYGHSGHTLLDMLRDMKPALAIIDSLASYQPEAEEKNSAATRMLQDFRRVAHDCGTASEFVHHRRKLSRKPGEAPEKLEHANLREWFQDARGASTLINGSDIRLGVDEPDFSASAKDGVALVLRGFGRVRGEIGPLYLGRDADDDGEPTGYRLLTGLELLMNNDQQRAFQDLPEQFGFADAKRRYDRADQPTRNWLMRCIDLGILRQPRRGLYEKVESDGAAGERK